MKFENVSSSLGTFCQKTFTLVKNCVYLKLFFFVGNIEKYQEEEENSHTAPPDFFAN